MKSNEESVLALAQGVSPHKTQSHMTWLKGPDNIPHAEELHGYRVFHGDGETRNLNFVIRDSEILKSWNYPSKDQSFTNSNTINNAVKRNSLLTCMHIIKV